MKQAPRSLLPAASAAPSVQETPKSKITKRQAVQRACNACRRVKCKCDGSRPVCIKCMERRTECIYDTIEGMSRNASLRNNNEDLTAKLEMYKDVFEDLLVDNPSQETQERIKKLGLSPRSARRRQSTSEQSREDTASALSYDTHSRPPSHPDYDAHPRQHSFPAQAIQLEWLGSGYDPNDGRISGKQKGWHPALVIRNAEVLESARTTQEPRGSEYREPFQRATQTKSFLHQNPWTEMIEDPVQTLHSEPLDEPPQTNTWHYSSSSAPDKNSSPFRPPPGAVTGYGNLPMSSAILANGYPPSIQRRQLLNFRVPEHTIPSLLVEENSDMARLYISFKDAALELIGNGFSCPQILGDPEVTCVDLLFRSRNDTDPLTVSNWACELVKNLPAFDMYIQLAWVGLLTKFMRWVIHPTADNYLRVPSMMKPIKVQRLIPHSPALDLCPHPGMRQALMQSYRDWLTPCLVENGGLECWKGNLEEAVLEDPATGHLSLRPNFEQHTQIKENWTYSPAISVFFPRAHEYGIRISKSGKHQDFENGATRRTWETDGSLSNEGSMLSSTNTISKSDLDEEEFRYRIHVYERIRQEKMEKRLAGLPSELLAQLGHRP